MIGVDDILDILQITVWSGGLKDERPLSVMLVASVGGGKTTMIKKTHKKGGIDRIKVAGDKKGEEEIVEVRRIAGSVLYVTNTSPHILCNRYGKLLKSGQIKHIAIPDFLNILNLPKYAVGSVISFYNSLIEEGILGIESRSTTFISEIPVTIGLITSIAKQDLNLKKDSLAAMGFLSRALPVSWRYSEETAVKIRQSIKLKEYIQDIKNFNITLPPPTEVRMASELADSIEKVAIRTKDSNDELGARRLKQLQVFCMASALRDSRTEVNKDDVLKLWAYEKYFNLGCTAGI
jgi:hypothetical protein